MGSSSCGALFVEASEDILQSKLHNSRISGCREVSERTTSHGSCLYRPCRAACTPSGCADKDCLVGHVEDLPAKWYRLTLSPGNFEIARQSHIQLIAAGATNGERRLQTVCAECGLSECRCCKVVVCSEARTFGVGIREIGREFPSLTAQCIVVSGLDCTEQAAGSSKDRR